MRGQDQRGDAAGHKAVPVAAQGVAVDPRLGVAWAADNGHGTLTEISEASNKVIHRITGLTDPNTVAVDTRSRTVWVTSDPFVKVYSEVTHRLLHTVRLGLNKFEIPWDLTIDPRAEKVWAAVIPSSDHLTRTWVAEISATKYKVIHTYPYVGGTAITAADPARGIVWMEVGDSRSPATIKVIKESTHHVVRTLTNMAVAPAGLVIDSRTKTVLATGIGNHFQAISETSGKIIRTIRIRAPSDVAVDQATGNIYVTVYSPGSPAVAQFRL